MNDTGECTLDGRDWLYADDMIAAAAAKGMPVAGVFKLNMKPGITYVTTSHPNGTIHVRWHPTEKGQESAL